MHSGLSATDCHYCCVLFTLYGCYTQAPKLDKASFLAELRGLGQTKGSMKGSGLALPAGTGPGTVGRPADPQAQRASGWGVLSDSFGLQGMTALLLLRFFTLVLSRFFSSSSSSFISSFSSIIFFSAAGQGFCMPSACVTDN